MVRSLVALIFMLASGCSADEPPKPIDSPTYSPPEPQLFKGYYVSGFERSEFRPRQRWWLSGAIEGCPFLDFNQKRYSPWRQTYLELKGVLSPPGQYGHLGAYNRELTIVETVSCRPPAEGEGVEP